MNIIVLAPRNLLRNWQRSLVTTLAMGFAGIIMILFTALMDGLLKASERNAVAISMGEMQIHAQGYRDDPDLYKVITDFERLNDELKSIHVAASPRLMGFALAAAGTSSAGIQLRGIEPEQEATVTLIHRHVAQGKWLDAAYPRGVVIGRKLARSLNVVPGDEIIVVGQARDGSMANDLYRVRGVLKAVGDEVDRGGFYMLAVAFRELMAMPEGVHEVAMMRTNKAQTLVDTRQQVAGLAEAYVTEDWRTLMPVIARILDLADAQTIFMLLITYVAVAMVVLNAMLMSVFERIREFGIMKALGVSPQQLMALIIAEAMLQALLASVVAVCIGGWIALQLQEIGIDLSAIASTTSFGGIAMEPVWYAEVSLRTLVVPVFFLFIVTFIAVIYPACKAALIRPVSALHHQ